MLASPHTQRSTAASAKPLWVQLLVVVLGAIATATTALLAPTPWGAALLGVLALGGAGWLVWRHPILAAALVPALLSPPQFLKVFAYEIALVAVWAVVLLAGLRARRDWLWRLDPIETALTGLLLWGAVTIFWSSSVWWWMFAMRKFGMGLMALWTAWRLARMADDPLPLLRGLTIGLLVLSAVVLVNAIAHGMLSQGASFDRIRGTDLGWGKANYLGAIVVLMLPSALHLAIHAPDRISRVLGWVSLPMSGVVMAVAASRGGAVLLLGISLAFVISPRLGVRILPMLMAMALAVGLLLLGPGSQQFIERFTSPRELGSIVVRLFLMRAGWRRILAHFPFGMGLGQGIVEPDHMGSGAAHNFLVTLTYEAGLPGLFLWLTLLTLLFRRAWAARRARPHATHARTLLFTLATATLNSLFEPTFEGLHFQFLFFWIVGLHLGTLSRDDRSDGLSRAERPAHA